MAVAQTTPLVNEEREIMATVEQHAVAVDRKNTAVSPVLTAFLIVMAAFPFIVGYLPSAIREYLGALFR